MGADRRLDEMHICDLLLRCIIGVNEDERSNRQDVVVNVTLYADLSEACRSDRIDRTVDYKALKARLVETVESSAFFLVEALAQTLADCCLSQPRVEKVRVRVDKPGALRFARTVGVEIVRERKVVAYIAVGSNVEPDTHIPAALEALACDARITGLSTFYRTPAIPGAPAMDRPDQADYVNGVVRIETGLSARDLKFGVLRRIEIAAGRVRVEDKFAPRTIDLDVALYGDATIDDPDLEVPDPNIVSRAFIWAPILELDPETVLPGTGKRIADLVSQEARRTLDPQWEFTQAVRRRLGMDEGTADPE